MRSTIASTKVALIAMIAVATTFSTVQANAEPAKPAAPAQPATPPDCDGGTALSFITTAQLINASAPYFEVGEIAPSLPETAYACQRLIAAHPNTVCSIPALKVVAKTKDLEEPCAAFLKAFKAVGGSLQAAPVTDTTPFGLLEAKSIRLTLQQPDKFQMLFNEPMKNLAVNGQVLGLMQAIESSSTVRCGIDRVSQYAGVIGLIQQPGQAFDGAMLYESFVAGVRASHLLVANGLIDVVCTKESNGVITLGDLKNAFGPIFNIEYLK